MNGAGARATSLKVLQVVPGSQTRACPPAIRKNVLKTHRRVEGPGLLQSARPDARAEKIQH